MYNLKIIIIFLTAIGIWAGGFLVGLDCGEKKAEGILYRIERLERRIGNANVIENGKTSGFAKAMISED